MPLNRGANGSGCLGIMRPDRVGHACRLEIRLRIRNLKMIQKDPIEQREKDKLVGLPGSSCNWQSAVEGSETFQWKAGSLHERDRPHFQTVSSRLEL